MVTPADYIAALIVPAVATTAGFALGWVARGLLEEHELPKTAVANGIAILVALTWFMSVLVGMTSAEYTTSIALHGIMGAVVGYFLGSGEGLTLNLTGQK